MKRAIILSLFFLVATGSFAQNAGQAGAFARMGFGARGLAFGNALTAVTTGEVSTYYNPAVSAFAEQRTGAISFGILSLDRYLNFISFTQPLKPQAGLSLGIINAGVRNIDGRDNDGIHTEDYSTFENQFYLSFSNRVDERVSLGVTVKLYYSKLFEEVTNSTVGFDAGVLVKLTEAISVGAAVQDLNSKYKWDTKAIYGTQDAKSIEDKFPNLRRIGVAYSLPDGIGTVAVDFENSSEKTNIVRMGAEYSPLADFSVRGGVDRYEFGDDATGAKPTFGFTVRSTIIGIRPALSYAFMTESYAPHAIHMITLSAGF